MKVLNGTFDPNKESETNQCLRRWEFFIGSAKYIEDNPDKYNSDIEREVTPSEVIVPQRPLSPFVFNPTIDPSSPPAERSPVYDPNTPPAERSPVYDPNTPPAERSPVYDPSDFRNRSPIQ
jgi:hypothetical protein